VLTSPVVKPALIGGLVTGVLSTIPVVSLGNACCCLWVVTGGMTAAYLLQQQQSARLTPVDGALVGVLSGVAAAFINLVLSIPVVLLFAPSQLQFLERLAESGQISQEFQDFIASPTAPVAMLALGFVFMLAAGLIFSTMGGLVGAAIFGRSTAASPPSTT